MDLFQQLGTHLRLLLGALSLLGLASGCSHTVGRDPLGFPRSADAATTRAILEGMDRFFVAWDRGDEDLFRDAVLGGGIAQAARWYPSIRSMDVVSSELFGLRLNPNPVSGGHISKVYWNPRISLETDGLALVRSSLATSINGELDVCTTAVLILVEGKGKWRVVNYLTAYDEQALRAADYDATAQCDALGYNRFVHRPAAIAKRTSR